MKRSSKRTNLAVVGTLWALLFVFVLGTLLFSQDSPLQRQNRKLMAKLVASGTWLHNLPRRTLQGTKETEPTLFLATGADYFSCLAAMLAVCICVGAISLIVAFFFCCFRWCFDLCGGTKPDPNGYSLWNRRGIKLGLVGTSVLILIVLILGLVGNQDFNPTIDILVDSLNTEAEKQAELVLTVEPRLNQVNANRTAYKGYVAALNREANATTENASRGKKYIGNNNVFRLLILGFCDFFIFLAIILGVVAALMSRGVPSMIAAFIGFFAIFMCWFNIAIHLPISVTVADFCYDSITYGLEQRLLDRDQSNGENYGGFDSFCHCPSWSNSNRTFFWALELKNDLIREQQQMMNASYNATAYDLLQASIDILEGVQVDCIYLRQCRWILNAMKPLQTTDVCDKKLEGAVYIWATSFVNSVLLIPFVVLAIVGYKRFPNEEDDGFF